MSDIFDFSKLRVALVHEFLIQNGGGERVLQVLAEIFPQAPIYVLLADKNKAAKSYPANRIISSWLTQLPYAKKIYQWYLPLMPSALESFDFERFDLVISSSSAFAKGVITTPHTLHICYCHTPTRYLWTNTYNYIKELHLPSLVKKIIPWRLTRLRTWDFVAAQRPDVFLANSLTVQKRIRKYYHREATVLYPPIDINSFYLAEKIEDYFLAGGRLVAYKRFDLLVTVFNKLGIKLKIFGIGPEFDSLKRQAKGNIELLGAVSDQELKKLYAEAKAFINPQEEDFGITMVESLASGRPVIAYNLGGALEIIKPGINGILFDEQTWECLADVIVRFRSELFSPLLIKESVEDFSQERFTVALKKIITSRLAVHE